MGHQQFLRTIDRLKTGNVAQEANFQASLKAFKAKLAEKTEANLVLEQQVAELEEAKDILLQEIQRLNDQLNVLNEPV